MKEKDKLFFSKKHNRKFNIVLVIFGLLVVATGCEKKTSTYEPKSQYSYNDIQECRVDVDEEEMTDEMDANGSGMAAEDSNTETQTTVIGENELVNIQSVPEMPPITENNIHIADAPQVHINDTNTNPKPPQNTDNQSNNQNPDGSNNQNNTQNQQTQNPTPQPAPEQKPDTSGANEGDTNPDPNATPTDATNPSDNPGTNPTPGDNPGGTTPNPGETPPVNPDPGGDDNPGDDGPTPGVTPDPEENDDCKIVNMYVEGDLGFYIWGETPDTSNIHLFVEYANGDVKEVTDYTVDMNYPELKVEISSYSREGVSFFSPEEKLGKINRYMPGIYNASVTYQGNTIEVSYKLVVFYKDIVINRRWNCTHVVEHGAHKTIPSETIIDCYDWDNIYICYSELNKIYEHGYLLGDMGLLHCTIIGDYYFSEADFYEALSMANIDMSTTQGVTGYNTSINKNYGLVYDGYYYNTYPYAYVYQIFNEP